MSITVIGADEVADYIRRINDNKERIARSWLRDNSIESVTTVQKKILNAGAVDTNELIQGFHYVIETDSTGIQSTIRPSDEADKYAIFVEEGTRPHRAPIEALRPWADRHGIPVGAVWHKIATEGTDPRYFARDAFEEIIPSVHKDVPRLANRLIDV